MSDISVSADKFEESIRKILSDLEFVHVKGGSGFYVGDHQIDAIGVCDGKMIIIECTTQKQNIKAKLEKWKGKQSSIRYSIKDSPTYRDYNSRGHIVFVLASKYNVIEPYKDYAEQEPRVVIWGPKLIDYYEKIAKAVPSRAKYDVLSDLGFEIQDSEIVTIPAFRYNFNEQELYTFFISPDELIKHAYVARRETGRPDFYQRMVVPKRLLEIAEFIKKGNIFPTNIVVGMEPKATFKLIPKNKLQSIGLVNFPKWLEFGNLSFPKSYQSLWIIDGQHRLFSFKKGAQQKLTVLALSNLTLSKQTKYFVDINSNAKPIDANLLWDLQGDLSPTSKEGILSRAVKLLDKKIPFEGKISIPSIRTRAPINIASFCSALLKMHFSRDEIPAEISRKYVHNPFYDNNYDKFAENIAESLAYFFKGISSVISSNRNDFSDFVFDNGGSSVFIYLYRVLICIEGGKKANPQMIEKYIKPLIGDLSSKSYSLIKDFKSQCSSEGGKQRVLNYLLNTLSSINSEINDYFTKSNLEDELKNLEQKMRKFVLINFISGNSEKLLLLIDAPIKTRVESKMGIKLNSSNVNKFFDELTFGEIKNIISYTFWNKIFKPIFIRDIDHNDPYDMRFPNDDLFKSQFNYAVEARNKYVHKKDQQSITTDDEKLIVQFVEKCNNILEKYQ